MSNADAAATATLPVRRRLSLRAFWPVVLLSLLILSASRAALMLWQSDLLPEGSVLYILGMGLRYDIASVLALFALPCPACWYLRAPLSISCRACCCGS